MVVSISAPVWAESKLPSAPSIMSSGLVLSAGWEVQEKKDKDKTAKANTDNLANFFIVNMVKAFSEFIRVFLRYNPIYLHVLIYKGKETGVNLAVGHQRKN